MKQTAPFTETPPAERSGCLPNNPKFHVWNAGRHIVIYPANQGLGNKNPNSTLFFSLACGCWQQFQLGELAGENHVPIIKGQIARDTIIIEIEGLGVDRQLIS